MLTAVLTAACNTTLLAAVAGVGWGLVRPGPLPRRAARAGLGLLAAGTAVSMLLAVYRSYTVPRDVMQDIVAAREFAAGRPMHPPDMGPLIRAALAEEGRRPSLGDWSPAVARAERRQMDLMLGEHWEQAHPPAVTLLTVPLVIGGGVLGTQAAYTLAGLLAVGLAVQVVRRELWPGAGRLAAAAGLVGVLGWWPVLNNLRCQQVELPLVAVLAGGWAAARRGRPAAAGGAAMAATAFKLVPGVLLVPVSVRHPRGGLAAAGLGVGVTCAILLLVPVADLQDYRAATARVAAEYAGYPANLSLLGWVARSGGRWGLTVPDAVAVWRGLVLGVLGGWLLVLVLRARRGRPADPDRDWAVGTALVPLLSPVTWDHTDAFLLVPLAVLARRALPAGSRAARAGFWLLVAVLSVPEPVYLAVEEALRAGGRAGLEVGLIDPLRTAAALAVVGWLAVAQRPGSGP